MNSSFKLCALITFCFILIVSNLSAQNNLWLRDITDSLGLNLAKGTRIVVVDINNDDYPDIFWGTGNAGKNQYRLLLNTENPNKFSSFKRIFIDFTEPSGINFNRNPNKDDRIIDVAAFADLDNDGDPDLVTSIYYHRLEYYKDTLDPGDRSEVYLNDGKGHFTLVEDNGLFDLFIFTNHPVGLINATGMSFLDYDLDGFIDLYISTWYGDRAQGIGMPDFLLKGQGNGKFINTDMPIVRGNYYPMYGVNVTDWDNDGWPDIVTSPYCNSNGNLFRNMQNGTFQDYSSQANYSATHMQGDNGQALCQWEAQPADFDNDGDMDILQVFVHGGYHSNEGRTMIAVNSGPEQGYRLEHDIELIQRDAPINSHLGDQGAQWFDLDGDGLLDLAIGQMAYPQANTQGQERLYICKQKKGKFIDVSRELGIFNKIKEAHSMEPLDYDLDGDQDLLVSHLVRDTTWKDTIVNNTPTKIVNSIENHMQIRLLENRVADIVTNSNYKRWISIKLEPPAGCNKSSIGARIFVHCGDEQYMQDIQSGLGHFAGQQPFIKNFSLDYIPRNIDSIVVHWPRRANKVTVAKGVPLNTIITIDSNGFTGYKKTWDMFKPVLAIENSLLDFGKVNTGDTKIMTFKLINYGETPLQISEIQGNLPEEFALAQKISYPLTIQPGIENALSLDLQFSPKTRKIFYHNLVIKSNAYNDSIALLRIKAYGYEDQPMITSAQKEYNFQTVFTDSTASIEIEIENIGEIDLRINEIMPPRLQQIFSITDIATMPIILKPSNSLKFKINFTPDSEQHYKDTIKILSNAYENEEYSIFLTGNGEHRKAIIQVSSSTILFGNVNIGDSRKKTLTISNKGSGTLRLNAITFEEPFEDIFQFDSQLLPMQVEPFNEKEIVFNFIPKEEKSYKTMMFLHSNSSVDSVFSIQILASGRQLSDVAYKREPISEKLVLYPNPASKHATLLVNDNINVINIKLLNLLGNDFPIKVESKQHNSIYNLTLNEMPKGIYIMLVYSHNNVYSVPLIIE